MPPIAGEPRANRKLGVNADSDNAVPKPASRTSSLISSKRVSGQPPRSRPCGNWSFEPVLGRCLPFQAFRPIASRSATTADGIWSVDALRFSRRCVREEVPGINRILGERWRSQASATCMGVASSDAAAESSADDCNGVKPPSGKNGTYAIPCAARSSMKASSFLWATL
jgi:hypothetical protein